MWAIESQNAVVTPSDIRIEDHGDSSTSNTSDEGYNSSSPMDSPSPTVSQCTRQTQQSYSSQHEAELLFQSILDTPDKIEALIQFARGEVAVAFQRLLQEKLDDSHKEYLSDYDSYDEDAFRPSEHRTLLRYLLKLSRTPDFVPTAFYVAGTACDNSDPITLGGSSDVFQGLLEGKTVALKQLRFNHTTNDEKSTKDFLREAIVWRQLRHPFVLPFLGIDIETSSCSPPKPRLVSPWMAKGNIIQTAKILKEQLQPIPLLRWLLESARGVQYLHKQDVIHGDIRGANILINDQGHVQITDFGLSTITDATTVTSGSHNGGTLQWMSPELLDGGEIRRPTRPCDVYSFGCFCVELYTLQSPYPFIKVHHQVYSHVSKGHRPSRPRSNSASGEVMSDIIWGMVQHCWHPRSSRPDIDYVVDVLASCWRVSGPRLTSSRST
ncbi:hypothetical protein QCA50_019983 [Cerrena zonata]|uniref:Protein kinase domain-containing protein n=1 Tax=Cerrena zonata TaxID=2478898 RepID=A0AAW0F8D1_9APHY